jgi:hypothetical protein
MALQKLCQIVKYIGDDEGEKNKSEEPADEVEQNEKGGPNEYLLVDAKELMKIDSHVGTPLLEKALPIHFGVMRGFTPTSAPAQGEGGINYSRWETPENFLWRIFY